MMDFAGKRILISGASSGIGAEFARQFHALGARVVLVARREERLRVMQEEFNRLRPDSSGYLAADLTDPVSEHGIKAVLAYIAAQRIDILVNNAGRGSFGYFDELSAEGEEQMVQLNITAVLRLTHAVLPQMKERRSGAIINVSSIAAFQPLPFMATYAASKSFEYIFSLGIRQELKDFGIRVLAVCPGPTDTEFGGVARVPGKLTGIRRDRAGMVAAESIRALQVGGAFVIPGLRARLISLLSRFLPADFSARLAGRVLKSSLPG